ncbi:HAMP domain-containing sensor histidine kinase [Geomicrobium sediminis]|uniref:histidine kinase n=1 Tax=Geomicrobium sediminis TaxID=1347788 RepID=A0ABS2PF61_9BACL|nr:HAMP domain-containing sensor histidine kinase [Geomicrobium sediminis]MBM7633959.1 two-component system sensor histidine kinase CssS [Geomicrobium sediminis]
MIRMNLTRRIWLSFAALLILVAVSMAVIYPMYIQGTLTEETYRIIEQAQNRQINPFSGQFVEIDEESAFIDPELRETGHLLIEDSVVRPLTLHAIPPDAIDTIINNAVSQEGDTERYELTFEGNTLFYVIKQFNSEDNENYLISFMWDSYRDSLINSLWGNFVYLLILTTAFTLLPAIWLTRYLRKPLRLLGNHFEQIAKRNWKEPFHWKGDEDFQKLSDQFELMRQNLIRHDKAQKTFIQHASHELKTPIMVVKTYAQSVKDGILPKNTVEESMDVILQEANRMDKRVKDMLYFTKLGAMKTETINRERISFGELAYRLEERYRIQRPDLSFVIQGAEIQFYGDLEQIQILLENLIENAMRYAETGIWISAKQSLHHVTLYVENDGEPIPEDERHSIFDPFRKGNKGQYGLGLAIVKQIVELHHGEHHVDNSKGRVSFQMTIPDHE